MTRRLTPCLLALAMLALACGSDDAGPSDASGDAADADATPDMGVVGETYWIADDGDDGAAGTESAPWATFPHALSQLSPGDTLIVKAGSRFSSFSYDCESGCDGGGCPNGEPRAPITVRAERPRTVRFENGFDRAFEVRQCSHLVLEGFETTQEEGMSADASYRITHVHESDHIVMRDMVVHSVNRWVNAHMLMITDSSHILLEDSELYDFHRAGVNVIASEHVTIRRVYVNSRDRASLTDPGAYQCCCLTTGDYGIWIQASFDVTVENCVIERTCQSVLATSNGDTLGALAGDALRVLGTIALDSRRDGYAIDSYCEDMVPCPEHRRIGDVEIIHSVAINSDNDAFRMNGVDGALLRNVTSIEAGTDFDLEVAAANVDIEDAHFLVVNALDVGTSGLGYQVTDQQDGTILSSNSFGNDADFDPMFPADGHGSVDPALGACRVYVPDASPMRGAGAGSEDIGARVAQRYVNGVLTDQPLWDPGTGAFPCGAVIEGGINDEATFPGGTCTTVHERLNVGQGGCAVP